MLKKYAIKKIITATIALIILFIICLAPTKNSEKITKNVNIKNPQTIKVYAQDNNGLLGQIKVDKIADTSDIEFIINVLTNKSSDSSILPIGFTPTLPQNTKLLDYEIINDNLALNFSKEFYDEKLNYEPIIESLIFSLCNEQIKTLTISIEGKKLENIPGTNKKIAEKLNKNYGINKFFNIDSIKNTSKVVIYYLASYNDYKYYIPITKVTNTNAEKIEVIVKELQTTPIYETNLISYLTASYELKNYEILEDTIKLSFNNDKLYNLNDTNITEEIKYTLAESLKDTYNINNILIAIN